MFYFAYGSNMSHQQMKERCPGAKFLFRAKLDGYLFQYDGRSQKRKGAVANVVLGGDGAVWGGVFEINADNLSALDCYEGYPNSYNRTDLDTKDNKGTTYKAIVYFRTGKDLGRPSEVYREIILRGAQDCGLPEEYIQSFL